MIYYVDCTAEGGSPKVHYIHAIFKAKHNDITRHLDYFSAKASAELDSTELR